LGGIALIAGAVFGIVTMALHPTGHDLFTPGRFDAVARLGVFVHALAIAGVPISFLGLLALTQRLQAPDRLAISALVVYGFGAVAVINAAAVSGFVAPGVAGELLGSTGATHDALGVALDYNHHFNQAFAKIYAVGASIAILLWSIAIVRGRGLGRGLGIYGIVIGPPTIVALVSGHLRLDVHGMGLVVLTQAIWFAAVGISMWRRAAG
jgi:hypothetical protein